MPPEPRKKARTMPSLYQKTLLEHFAIETLFFPVAAGSNLDPAMSWLPSACFQTPGQSFTQVLWQFISRKVKEVSQLLLRVASIQGMSPHKIILHPPSRSFGKIVSDLQSLSEAVSSFTVRAAERLRAMELVAGGIAVHIHTSKHEGEVYDQSAQLSHYGHNSPPAGGSGSSAGSICPSG